MRTSTHTHDIYVPVFFSFVRRGVSDAKWCVCMNVEDADLFKKVWKHKPEERIIWAGCSGMKSEESAEGCTVRSFDDPQFFLKAWFWRQACRSMLPARLSACWWVYPRFWLEAQGLALPPLALNEICSIFVVQNIAARS
jgi:hypothetical protein